MNPIYHAESAAKKWGGTIEDYLSIEEKMQLKQLDLEMNLIKIWSSAKEAADSLKIYVGSIHNVLGKQKSKTAGGFKWEYVNKKNNKYYESNLAF